MRSRRRIEEEEEEEDLIRGTVTVVIVTPDAARLACLNTIIETCVMKHALNQATDSRIY